MYNKGNLSDIL